MDVKIRRFKPDDLHPLFEAASESIEAAYTWLPWCHPNYSLEDAQRWIDYQDKAWDVKNEYAFVITDQEEKLFLGGCGLINLHATYGWAMLGYWVRKSFHNEGIATQATKLTAKYGLFDLDFNRIEIIMATGNIASKRVAEKSGAFYEGIARNKLIIHNKPTDSFIYSFIKSDFFLP